MKSSLLLLIVTAAARLTGQSISPNKTYPSFPVGPTGIEATIEPSLQVTVQKVAKEAPAHESGLQAGDVLLSLNGEKLSVSDPRVALGRGIGMAEADDGILTFTVARGEQRLTASVQLPVLEAYRPSWPKECPKSRAITQAHARHLSDALGVDGHYQLDGTRLGPTDLKACLAGLFLLSTGEDVHLSKVGRQARTLATLAESRQNAGGHINWQLGYQGIFLGEYYLRTGDRAVLKGLQEICVWAAEGQAAGGWGHGSTPGPGYVQSGLLNHTTVPILTALILARECGVAVDEQTFGRAIKFMYRMVGHGCVPYGDHRSELWWSNTNGRNAMLACAFSLLDEPRFQKAAAHLAVLVTDSYHQPEFGHTGGGFNMIWRGMASAHVPASHESHRERQMKTLAWYYDLARLPDGGFCMLSTPPDNARYFGRGWGAALGLTYTAPQKTLRITGAAPTRFSVKQKPVNFSWGSEADLAFLSIEAADGYEGEIAPPHLVYEHLLGSKKDQATVDFCAAHLGHFSPLVRAWAGKRLREMKSQEAIEALAKAVDHPDPRVRRAVYDAVSGYDNWGRPFKPTITPEVVSERFLAAIIKTIKNPTAAWWEKDGALFALGCAKPESIRQHLPLILAHAKHQEWYLREAAFWALVGLHDSITGEEFQHLSEIYRDSRHVFARSSYDAGFRTILRTSRARIQEDSIKRAVQDLGKTIHHPGVMEGYGDGGLHEAAHRTMMVLKHFGSAVGPYLVDDLAAYLDLWEPYYQHSVWLITGSKWQPGIPKLLADLGREGQPVILALKRLQKRYPSFDRKRVGKAGKDLEVQIAAAIAEWEKRNGPS